MENEKGFFPENSTSKASVFSRVSPDLHGLADSAAPDEGCPSLVDQPDLAQPSEDEVEGILTKWDNETLTGTLISDDVSIFITVVPLVKSNVLGEDLNVGDRLAVTTSKCNQEGYELFAETIRKVQ